MHDGLGFTAFYSIPIILAIAKILGVTAGISALVILLSTAIRSGVKDESLQTGFSKLNLFRWKGLSRWLAFPTSLVVLSLVPSLVMSLMYLKIWGFQPIGTSFADFRMEIHRQYWVGADLGKRWSRFKHAAKPHTSPSVSTD